MTVAAKDLETLRRIAGSHPASLGGQTIGEGTVNFFGVPFAAANTCGYRFRVNQSDRATLLTNIADARRQAACVVVSLHAHQPANWSVRPADCLRELCHEMVDAGADVVFGHGPHRIRGVELYDGKPIFYSLGNFIYHADVLDDAALQAAGVVSASADATHVAMIKQLWQRIAREDAALEGLAAMVTLSPGRRCDVRLVPVDLESRNTHHRGTPRLAVGGRRRATLREAQTLSAEFETTVDIDSGSVLSAATSTSHVAG